MTGCPSTTVLKFPEVVSCYNRQFNYKILLSNDQHAIDIYQLSLAYGVKERNITSNQVEETQQLTNFIAFQVSVDGVEEDLDSNVCTEATKNRFGAVLGGCGESLILTPFIFFSNSSSFFLLFAIRKTYKCFLEKKGWERPTMVIM